jgi:hypothetical protein
VEQGVRRLLVPFQAAFVAEHPDVQAVLGAGRRVGDPHRAARIARKAQQQVGVVVRAPARPGAAELGCDLGQLKPVMNVAR